MLKISLSGKSEAIEIKMKVLRGEGPECLTTCEPLNVDTSKINEIQQILNGNEENADNDHTR